MIWVYCTDGISTLWAVACHWLNQYLNIGLYLSICGKQLCSILASNKISNLCYFIFSSVSVVQVHISAVPCVFSHSSGMAVWMTTLIHHFGPNWNISITIRWIASPTDFGDPLTFPLPPPWHLWFWVKCLDNRSVHRFTSPPNEL